MNITYTHSMLNAAADLGCRIQIWHLVPGATSSADGQWDDADPTVKPTFECPAHLYRVHPDDLHLLRAGHEKRAWELLRSLTNMPFVKERTSKGQFVTISVGQALAAIMAALEEAPAEFIDPNSRNFKEGFSVGQIVGRDEVRSQYPPCLQCGAETASQAETMCCMAGDEDNCHGCELWTEDERINSTAPVAWLRHRSDGGVEGSILRPAQAAMDYVDIANRVQAKTGRIVFPSTAKAILDAALAQPQGQQPCDMGEMCIGCEPRNDDGSCPDAQPQGRDAQAVDLEQFRPAVEHWKRWHAPHEIGYIEANRILALIDAQSAKGDGDA